LCWIQSELAMWNQLLFHHPLDRCHFRPSKIADQG